PIAAMLSFLPGSCERRMLGKDSPPASDIALPVARNLRLEMDLIGSNGWCVNEGRKTRRCGTTCRGGRGLRPEGKRLRCLPRGSTAGTSLGNIPLHRPHPRFRVHFFAAIAPDSCSGARPLAPAFSCHDAHP